MEALKSKLLLLMSLFITCCAQEPANNGERTSRSPNEILYNIARACAVKDSASFYRDVLTDSVYNNFIASKTVKGHGEPVNRTEVHSFYFLVYGPFKQPPQLVEEIVSRAFVFSEYLVSDVKLSNERLDAIITWTVLMNGGKVEFPVRMRKFDERWMIVKIGDFDDETKFQLGKEN